LNDILDLAKIEAGKMALHPRDIILRDVFERLMALFSQIARQKGNKLSFELADDIPECVLVDETRLLQILSNLTSNALKFTDIGGKINIEVHKIKDISEIVKNKIKINFSNHHLKLINDAKKDVLLISVEDTGIGIKKED
jgi:signal transduction histidine kinase